jgi:hypothetical protein
MFYGDESRVLRAIKKTRIRSSLVSDVDSGLARSRGNNPEDVGRV